MKKMRYIVLFAALAMGVAFGLEAKSRIGGDCTLNGKRLSGSVRVVTDRGDVRVKIDNSIFADLRVQKMDSSHVARSCGEWYFSDSDLNNDFTIQFVEYNEDFSISYVDYYPGLP